MFHFGAYVEYEAVNDFLILYVAVLDLLYGIQDICTKKNYFNG